MGVGVALGASLGVALGALFDDVGTWLAIGTAVGCALGASGVFGSECRTPSQQAQDPGKGSP